MLLRCGRMQRLKFCSHSAPDMEVSSPSLASIDSTITATGDITFDTCSMQLHGIIPHSFYLNDLRIQYISNRPLVFSTLSLFSHIHNSTFFPIIKRLLTNLPNSPETILCITKHVCEVCKSNGSSVREVKDYYLLWLGLGKVTCQVHGHNSMCVINSKGCIVFSGMSYNYAITMIPLGNTHLTTMP